MTTRATTFRELDRAEIEQMLETHAFGRIAFTFHNRVDIEPISYVYHDGWIYGRTAPGTKLTVIAHSPWVAFEIDEVKAPLNWRSVVVKGTIYFLEHEGTAAISETYEEAVRLIRRIAPDAFTERDQAPERTVLFRLHVDEFYGRAAE